MLTTLGALTPVSFTLCITSSGMPAAMVMAHIKNKHGTTFIFILSNAGYAL
jgi:hypothetical protein